MMYFRDILQRPAPAFPPREMNRFAAERLVELEVGAVTSVADFAKNSGGGRAGNAERDKR
jgi:hypothetical protein